MITAKLIEAYRFHLAHGGYCTPPGRVACALAMAHAEIRGKELGLEVKWEDEFIPWDADVPPPRVHAMASVYHPDREPNARRSDPHYYVLAHLGSVALDSWRDPYMRVVEAELMCEAIRVMDEENERKWEQEAFELAARATYAGVSP